MSSTQHLMPPLACMATGLTFFLGFLPAKKVPSPFFVLHTLVAATLWFLIFIQNQNSIFVIMAVCCGMAWHNFRVNNSPTAKVFLAVSSGLSVGFGLFHTGLIPVPASLPPSWGYVWVLSILFSAAVLGSCYLALLIGTEFERNKSLGQEVFEKCLQIFLTTLALRALLFLTAGIILWFGNGDSEMRLLWFPDFQVGPVLISRFAMGLILPASITIWGLARLKKDPSSFKLIPFYVVIFLVLSGEMSAYKFGF